MSSNIHNKNINQESLFKENSGQYRFEFIEPLRIGDIEFDPELEPKIIVEDGDYTWFAFNEDQTGLKLVGMIDLSTGYIITAGVPNPKMRSASINAWAAARHSRAEGYSWEIMNEIVEKSVNTDTKLETTFVGYGHASVGGLAQNEIHIENIEMDKALTLFNNNALVGGQEKSTRFQVQFLKSIEKAQKTFEKIKKQEIKERSLRLLERQMSLVDEYYQRISQRFEELFNPTTKAQFKALEARTLDTARSFMPMGLKTGMSLSISARELSRNIADLKASNNKDLNRLANQLQRFLTPSEEIEHKLGFKAESPGLIRHAEANTLINDNQNVLLQYLYLKYPEIVEKELRDAHKFKGRRNLEVIDLSDYKEEELMIAQRINLLFPNADIEEIVMWVSKCEKKEVLEMISIIKEGHDNHKELALFDETGPYSFVLSGSIAELRDWNRHQASRRFVPMPMTYGEKRYYSTAKALINRGYTLPSYLVNIEEMHDMREDFEKDLIQIYKEINELLDKAYLHSKSEDVEDVLSLMPFATNIPLVMHHGLKQANYLGLRQTVGAHINCREQAEALAFLIDKRLRVEQDKAVFNNRPKVECADADQFFDRS